MLAAYSASSTAPACIHRAGCLPRRRHTSGCTASSAAASGHTNTSVVHIHPAVDMASQS